MKAVQEIVAVPTNTQLFEKLVEDCQIVMVSYYRKADRLKLEAHWRLGDVLGSYEDRLPYGEEVMKTLAERLKIHLSELYFSKALREKCASLQALMDLIDERGRKGLTTSWYAIKSELLTLSHRTLATPLLLNQLERSLHVLEQVQDRYQTMSPGEQMEADGLIEKAKDTILEFGFKLSTMQLYKDEPDRSEKYLAFVRSLPCSVCSSTQSIHAHHTERDIGQKGSDFLTIPLCAMHHEAYHKLERDQWEKKYSAIDKMLIKTLVEWVRRTVIV